MITVAIPNEEKDLGCRCGGINKLTRQRKIKLDSYLASHAKETSNEIKISMGR